MRMHAKRSAAEVRGCFKQMIALERFLNINKIVGKHKGFDKMATVDLAGIVLTIESREVDVKDSEKPEVKKKRTVPLGQLQEVPTNREACCDIEHSVCACGRACTCKVLLCRGARCRHCG